MAQLEASAKNGSRVVDDKSLSLLLSFGLPDEGFSLAGVDFRVLTEIAPARVKSTFEQRDSAPSANDLTSRSSPPEDFDPAGESLQSFKT
jgi:hypothetical protein